MVTEKVSSIKTKGDERPTKLEEQIENKMFGARRAILLILFKVEPLKV